MSKNAHSQHKKRRAQRRLNQRSYSGYGHGWPQGYNRGNGSYNTAHGYSRGSVSVKDPEDSADLSAFNPADGTTKVGYIGDRSTPEVYISPEAHDHMVQLVDMVEGEVGWLGILEEVEENVLYIPEIFLLDQEVSAATTDLDSEAIGQLASDLLQDGRTEAAGKLNFWGHSHHTMGVSPSSTDDSTVMEVYGEAEDIRHCLRGIFNRDGDVRLDYFDFESGIIFKNLDWKERDLTRDASDMRKGIHEQIESKVDYSSSSYSRTKTTSKGSTQGSTKQKNTTEPGKYQGIVRMPNAALTNQEEMLDAYRGLFETDISELPDIPDRVEHYINAFEEQMEREPENLKEVWERVAEAQNFMVMPPQMMQDGDEQALNLYNVNQFLQEEGRLPITWLELY